MFIIIALVFGCAFFLIVGIGLLKYSSDENSLLGTVIGFLLIICGVICKIWFWIEVVKYLIDYLKA